MGQCKTELLATRIEGSDQCPDFQCRQSLVPVTLAGSNADESQESYLVHDVWPHHACWLDLCADQRSVNS